MYSFVSVSYIHKIFEFSSSITAFNALIFGVIFPCLKTGNPVFASNIHLVSPVFAVTYWFKVSKNSCVFISSSVFVAQLVIVGVTFGALIDVMHSSVVENTLTNVGVEPTL